MRETIEQINMGEGRRKKKKKNGRKTAMAETKGRATSIQWYSWTDTNKR